MYQPTHVLSEKSSRQHRNVFVWCTEEDSVALAYRWITNAVLYQASSRSWEEAERFTLFPVEVRPNYVMTYSVHKNGAALSRESQDIIAPGDYGLYTPESPRLYTYFNPLYSFADMEDAVKENSPSLSAKASLGASLIQQAFDRDRQCIFSGVVPTCESDPLVATWVFPPFLGYKLSNDYKLESKYYANPDACDLSELMVIQNVVSGRKDIIALFWENKLGIDVDVCIHLLGC
ncbi:hypothetical protein BYT27DRAFT_6377119 [Phlegmacium glaucopus]|nr:hypothetical protein BYT27DRAFT_6377119 [Phlegmacium glaucopus]